MRSGKSSRKDSKPSVKLLPKYTKDSLGLIGVFLLPSLKLKEHSKKNGKTFEEIIHQFLMRKFNGYTAAGGNIFGYWKSPKGREFYGEHKEYRVSFTAKEDIPTLEGFLAKIGAELREQSIYMEIGEKSWLIYPKG